MIETPQILAVLEQNRWFASQPAALKTALIEHARSIEVARGQWLYGAGDAPGGLYAVLSGSVDIMMGTIADEDVLIDIAQAGRVFSQASGPRLITALANEDSRLLHIADHALRLISRGHPDIWRNFTALLYEQLSAALQMAANMIHLAPQARIAARLLFLAGIGARDGVVARVTQSQLAELTGLSRKTVNGHLADLARRGVVEPGYGGLALRNLAGLRRIARA
jgi:CRP/FNR family transcriptional regulator, cyclic AMP receptor protein